jgi:hypothetical protein
VKKLPVIATMLLLMGLFMVPACDEDKGTDPLALAALYNSKYYLEFDADYDNDGTVEHIKMSMRHPFDLISFDNWFQGYFTYQNQNQYSYISIPDTIPGPTTYHGGDLHFYMSYDIGHDDYMSVVDHVFTFNIIQWDGIGGDIYAEFSGELSNDHTGAEKTIIVSNGKVFSKIQK